MKFNLNNNFLKNIRDFLLYKCGTKVKIINIY